MADIPGVRYSNRGSPWKLALRNPTDPIRMARAKAAGSGGGGGGGGGSSRAASIQLQTQIKVIEGNLKVQGIKLQNRQQTQNQFFSLMGQATKVYAGLWQEKGTSEYNAAATNYNIGMKAIREDFGNRPLFTVDPDNPRHVDGRPNYSSNEKENEEAYVQAVLDLKQQTMDGAKSEYGSQLINRKLLSEEVGMEDSAWLTKHQVGRAKQISGIELGMSMDYALTTGDLSTYRDQITTGMNTGLLTALQGVAAMNKADRKEVELNFNPRIQNFENAGEGLMLRQDIEANSIMTPDQKKTMYRAVDDRLIEQTMDAMDRIYTDNVATMGHEKTEALMQQEMVGALGMTPEAMGFGDQNGKKRLLSEMGQRLNDYKQAYAGEKAGIGKQHYFTAFDSGSKVNPEMEDAEKHGNAWFENQRQQEDYSEQGWQQDVIKFAGEQDWLPQDQMNLIKGQLATGTPAQQVTAAALIEELRVTSPAVYAGKGFSKQAKVDAYEIAQHAMVAGGDSEELAKRMDRRERLRAKDPNKRQALDENYEQNIQPELETMLMDAIEDDKRMLGADGSGWSNWGGKLPENVQLEAMLDYEMWAGHYAQMSDSAETVGTLAYRDWSAQWSPTTMYGNATPLLEKNSVASIMSGGRDMPWHRESWSVMAKDMEIDPLTHRAEFKGVTREGAAQWRVTDESGALVMFDVEGKPQVLLWTPNHETTPSRQVEQANKQEHQAREDSAAVASFEADYAMQYGTEADKDQVNPEDLGGASNPQLRKLAPMDDPLANTLHGVFNVNTQLTQKELEADLSREEIVEIQVRRDMERAERMYGGDPSWSKARKERMAAMFERNREDTYDTPGEGDFNPAMFGALMKAKYEGIKHQLEQAHGN